MATTHDLITTTQLGSRHGDSLLDVKGLSVAYGQQQVVTDVSFSLARGESLALIGESGSGKTTIARTVLRLLPAGAQILGGRVDFNGQDISSTSERSFRALRGAQLGFVPQDPANALNPVRTVGVQAHEATRVLNLKSRAEERELILKTFADVGLPDPARVYSSHPHQLSGGMIQRVLIGLAVLPGPALLVADEPTSGLDVTIQKVVLDLLTGFQQRLGLSLLFITHDLALAAERADSLVVLKNGAVQEQGPSREVFAAPTSDYARELQADVPAINPNRYRLTRTVRPEHVTKRADNQVELRHLTKTFDGRNGLVTAVNDVSISVRRGSTHALVGESGSGKTTTVRLLLGLEMPDSGDIVVGSETVSGQSRREWRSTRRHLQLVYQNPFTSLDPTWKLGQIIGEPLDRFNVGDRPERRQRVAEVLSAVGLSEEFLTRRPRNLSGGQRQRVAIARALVTRPDVLVLDEPTSALDVTVQAAIMDLLVRLQDELGLTYIFVSHDLSLVRQIADTVTVLRHGAVVEDGAVEQIFAAPRDAYTRALLAAIPAVNRASAPVAERDVLDATA